MLVHDVERLPAGLCPPLELVLAPARAFFVGDRYSIADIAIYAYTHCAGEAGFDLAPLGALREWFARVESQPRFIPGPEPYSAAALAPVS
jgi:glutathione S-transferase